MKRDNCIDVKHVSHLSVNYLSRFFGSVGPVSKVEKDEVSKYVTIQFVNRNSVQKAFRFNGRVLDSRPIKIKKCREDYDIGKGIEQYRQQKQSPRFYISESTYSSLNNMQDMWNLILQQVKPHHFQQEEHLLLSMFIWALIDQLLVSVNHIHRHRNNRRSGYLTNTLEKYIVDKIARKSSNMVIGEYLKTTIEQKGAQTLVWFTVPFPNIQEDEAKIQSVSCMTKCIHSLKNGLSLRLAQIVYVLNAASLCSNTQQTGSEDLISLNPQVRTTQQDNFIGVVDNLGAVNIFHQWLVFERPNSCIYLSENGFLQTWHCTLRLEGCQQQEFQDANWCNMYTAQIIKKNFKNKDAQYIINRIDKLQNIKLKEQVLIFQYGQFSLKTVEEQLSIFKKIQPLGAMVFYINKELGIEKTHQFKKVYEDDIMKILEQVEHVESMEQAPVKKQSEPEQQEVVAEMIQIEIKSENSQLCKIMCYLVNNLKLTHYLEHYIEESIVSKGLIIASKQMAIKLGANIIQREKESRLFEFGYKRYEQFVGEELWRVYNRQGERKIKTLLSKYTRERK